MSISTTACNASLTFGTISSHVSASVINSGTTGTCDRPAALRLRVENERKLTDPLHSGYFNTLFAGPVAIAVFANAIDRHDRSEKYLDEDRVILSVRRESRSGRTGNE